MATKEPLPHLMNVTELADHLGIQVRHVRRLVFERRIPYLKVGRLLRFDPSEVRSWLEDSRRAPRPSSQRSSSEVS